MDSTNHDGRIIALDRTAAISILPQAPPRPGITPGEGPSETATSNIVPLTEELRYAGRIQRSLLPRQFPKFTGWDVSGSCLAAGAIGGDFFDIQQLPRERTLFIIADVMGKGIPAALIASVMRAVVRNVALTAEGPGEILGRVNELIYEDLSNAEMFVTAQAACLDLREQTFEIASAGHCPLLLRKHGQVGTIGPSGIPIGVSPRACYGEECTGLEGLDMVLMHTDGITEARNKIGESFGSERLEQWLDCTRGDSAEGLKQDLAGILEVFQDGAKPRDDQTFLIFTRLY